MYIADLHIHSKYSRATSRDCVPETLALWARRKGLHLLGTGDFTHPAWRAELSEKLCPQEEGLYTLKPAYRLSDDLVPGEDAPRFVLSGEISTIYKKDGRVRKVHSVILLPSLEAAQALSNRLEAVGNLHSDGRPILGLDSRNLLEITLEACADALFIPAHIWTPHFSLFGAYSGFDAIEACFGDLTDHVYALETGLSSDPAMNWRLSALDRFAMVSNSDAHSPQNLAREANLFETDLSYPALVQALKHPQGNAFAGTIEFFPEEGKYHCDGHRACKVCMTPSETRAGQGLCPACGKRVTLGVLHRVEALADRPEGFAPPQAKRYESMVPLREVAAACLGVTPAAGKAQKTYEALLKALGPELYILREAPLSDVEQKAGQLIAEGIRRLRAGKVEVQPGYDGEYGRVTLLSRDEIMHFSGQVSLLEGMPPPARQPAKKPAKAARADETRPLPARETAAAEAAHPYGLNPAQWAAACEASPVVSVVAGPGTGKTKTLVSRALYLMEQCGVAPETITAVTFTNKAAGEMRARLASHLGGPSAAKAVNIGTFHAICLRLLADARGEAITLLTEPDALAIMGAALKDLGSKASARDALSRLSLAKNGVEAAQGEHVPPEAFERYRETLAALGALDFDDLLLEALAYSEGNESAAQGFAHLLVDEFQDVSPVQYRLIKAWAAGGRSLFVIGDADQAIYGFRGSDARCFDRLHVDFPQARQIRLTQNYRSTPEILSAAQAVIAGQPARSAAPALKPVRAGGEAVRLLRVDSALSEGIAVAKAIGRMVGGIDMLQAHGETGRRGKRSGDAQARGFSDIAVLYRTNRQAEILEQCLAQEGIPYIVAGREPFLAQPPVRQATAFFRLLQNPADLLSLRICVADAGFYGRADAQRILDAYRQEKKSLPALEAVLAAFPPAERLSRPGLVELLAKYAPMLTREKPALVLDQWIHDNALSGEACMELLRSTALMHGDMTSFLYTLALGQEGDVQRSGGRRYRLEAVTLMTLHGAKGLEYPAVFLCGANEGLLPFAGYRGPADSAEERRLLYVGMTRAKDALCLLTYDKPSPFLADIPPDALDGAGDAPHKRQAGAQLSFL